MCTKDIPMNIRKKMIVKIVAIVAIICAVSLVLPVPCNPWLPVVIVARAFGAGRIRVRLLCETDHQALLEACRELSSRFARGELKPGKYWVRINRDPEVSTFPQPILDLRPSSIYIDDNTNGSVRVEMLGGLDHVGVMAYPEDFKEPWPNFKYGDKELIPGLWYYDDLYEGDPKYDEKIEALLKKRKQAH
jgi:hypothetical protein